MSEEYAPNTPRRSVRIAARRASSTKVGSQELPTTDTLTTAHPSNGTVIIATASMPVSLSNTGVLTSKKDIGCGTRGGQQQLDMYKLPASFHIRYFNHYREPRCPRQINEHIRRLVISPFQLRSVGHVYCFKHPDDHDMNDHFGPNQQTAIHPIKIGRAKIVRKRLRAWQSQCRYAPVLIFGHRMPEHERIEAIVHAQLHNARRKEYRGCAACGAKHDEWFDTDASDAECVVGLWRQFTSHWMAPYDASGWLVPRWRERLEQVDLDDANCWTWFVRWDLASPIDSQAQPLGNHEAQTAALRGPKQAQVSPALLK